MSKDFLGIFITRHAFGWCRTDGLRRSSGRWMHRGRWLVWCAYPVIRSDLGVETIALGRALMRFLLAVLPFEYGPKAPNASVQPAT